MGGARATALDSSLRTVTLAAERRRAAAAAPAQVGHIHATRREAWY